MLPGVGGKGRDGAEPMVVSSFQGVGKLSVYNLGAAYIFKILALKYSGGIWYCECTKITQSCTSGEKNRA